MGALPVVCLLASLTCFAAAQDTTPAPALIPLGPPNIVTQLSEVPELSTLGAIIDYLGLTSVLETPYLNLTIYAPTDDAFSDYFFLGNENGTTSISLQDWLAENQDKAQQALSALLAYHLGAYATTFPPPGNDSYTLSTLLPGRNLTLQNPDDVAGQQVVGDLSVGATQVADLVIGQPTQLASFSVIDAVLLPDIGLTDLPQGFNLTAVLLQNAQNNTPPSPPPPPPAPVDAPKSPPPPPPPPPPVKSPPPPPKAKPPPPPTQYNYGCLGSPLNTLTPSLKVTAQFVAQGTAFYTCTASGVFVLSHYTAQLTQSGGALQGLTAGNVAYKDGVEVFSMAQGSATASVAVGTSGGYTVPNQAVYDSLPQFLRTSLQPTAFLQPVAYVSMTTIQGGQAPKPGSPAGRKLLQADIIPSDSPTDSPLPEPASPSPEARSPAAKVAPPPPKAVPAPPPKKAPPPPAKKPPPPPVKKPPPSPAKKPPPSPAKSPPPPIKSPPPPPPSKLCQTGQAYQAAFTAVITFYECPAKQ